MIELRWLNRNVEFHEGKGEFFQDSVLQYRKQGVSCIDEFEWQDVPEVME